MATYPTSVRSLKWALTPALRVGFVCLVLTFGLLDTVTSWLNQMAFPISKEGNPVVFLLQQGPLPLLIAVKLLCLALVYVLAASEVRTKARSWTALIFAASALCLLVAASNLLLFLTSQDLVSYFLA